MTDLLITASANSPLVHFQCNGNLELSGKIILDQNDELWNQMFIWIENYKAFQAPLTKLTLQIDYLNSSSLKELNKFLILIASLSNADSELNIFWYYNASDIYMREIGLELSKQSGFNFQMKIVKEFV